VKFESHARERLLDPIANAFEAAVDDVVTLARANAARHSRTGTFERSITRTDTVETASGRLEARVGSPLSSAKAKEKGAYIRARRGPYLVFQTNDGWRKVAAVRLAPQPAVAPAAARFQAILLARIKDAGR